MKQYHDLLTLTKLTGERTPNRTGIDTFMIPGAHLSFDLRDGFPAITTKRLAFGQVKGELLGFLKAATSAKQFRDYGCNVWNANANDPGLPGHLNVWLSNPHRKGTDDLGKIYGVQWRNFDGYDARVNGYTVQVQGTDQIETALHTVLNNPESRRILVNAWNPNQLDQMALPPCHILFQLLPNPSTRIMHMCMYQRSCDLFLGIPFNIASYALLLELFCRWTGYRAGKLNMFLADVHIYENHLEQVQTQLQRTSFSPPRLHLGSSILAVKDLAANPFNAGKKLVDQLLQTMALDDITLENYKYHPAIAAPMAV